MAANESKLKKNDRAKRSEKKKKTNAITRYWRSTIGELRKVSWPTSHEAWRLTKVVIMVVLAMAMILGLLDFVFSQVVALIV